MQKRVEVISIKHTANTSLASVWVCQPEEIFTRRFCKVSCYAQFHHQTFKITLKLVKWKLRIVRD